MPALRYSDGPKLPFGAGTFVSDGRGYNLLDIVITDRRVSTYVQRQESRGSRQNALKSTGPKTPDGKAAVRLNALRHGLLSQEILLPGENEEALRELAEGLRAELQPVGELEDLLVDRITSLEASAIGPGGGRRIYSGILRRCRGSDASTLGLTFIRDGNGANAFSKLSRYETTMERGLYKALHERQRLQANRVAAGSIPLPPGRGRGHFWNP